MAQICIRLALRSCVAQRADAPVAVDQVDAFASVGARCAGAFVHIRLALAAAETRRTGAVVFVNKVDTRGAVEALVTVAVVDVHLALASVKSFNAVARIVARRVVATLRVAAQFWHRTLVHILFASVALPALGALALVAILQVDAGGAVVARR